MWSDTRSEPYEHWSDFRSDVYDFWSNVKIEIYNDDIEGAQEEIADFTENVENCWIS